MVGSMHQSDLFLIWTLIILIGLTLIAIRKGWVRKLSNGLTSLFFQRSPLQIDLAWEVRRIRKILEWFYFLTWLSMATAIFYFLEK
jgi:hypothetical protein